MAKHKEPSVRQLRVGEELRHAMAEILGRGVLRDPALSGRAFTVTEVRMSPDLKRATVFLTPLGGDADPALLVALDRGCLFSPERSWPANSPEVYAAPVFSPTTVSNMRPRLTVYCGSQVSRAICGVMDPKMSRRRKSGQLVNGWVILDKPAGMTSTSAVSAVRRRLDARKAGHAGTLDPLATGVLPIALGEATKTLPYVVNGQKKLSVHVALGCRDNDR